jgi:hypothetical protein
MICGFICIKATVRQGSKTFCVGISKGRDLVGDLGEDGTILLKLFLSKYGMGAWTGIIYCRVGSTDILDRAMALMSSKDSGNCWLTGRMLLSRKGGVLFFFIFFFS